MSMVNLIFCSSLGCLHVTIGAAKKESFDDLPRTVVLYFYQLDDFDSIRSNYD
jgi:hypothetical protein